MATAGAPRAQTSSSRVVPIKPSVCHRNLHVECK
jgi:hypothetical protein